MEKYNVILVVFLIFLSASLVYILLPVLFYNDSENEFYVPVVTGDNIPTYKNSCSELNISTSFDYSALNDKNVKITGQIFNKTEYVQFNKTQTGLLIIVPGLSDPPYILVTYADSTPYNINDTITVYGKYYYPVRVNLPSESTNKDLINIMAGYIEKV
nr:hypothetical protein [uncultured Methanobacterium sp.]